MGKIMKLLSNLKIKNKLIAIILLVTILTLIIASTSIILIEKPTRWESLKNEITIAAKLTTENLIGPLEFGNEEDELTKVLSYLKLVTSIKSAWVYNKTDEVIASYVQSGSKPGVSPALPRREESIEILGNFIHYYEPIYYNEVWLGTLYIIASTEKFDEGIANFTLLMAGLVFILIALSVLLANRLQSIISKPILELGEASRKISSESNYGLRVQKKSNDEIGRLYDAFNEMMDQILNRDLERDRVEAQLISARFFLSSVIDSMPSLLITVERNGGISQWNKATADIMGISEEEALGKELWELFPSFIGFQQRIETVDKQKISLDFYKESLIINDNPFYFNGSIFPLMDAGIREPRFVIMLNNVTEIELKERQLRQSQKMETVGNLAGGLAHDFNNVLGGIIGTISLYKYKASKSKDIAQPEIEKYFNTMEEAANRASDMVQHLLSLTRKQELSFTPTELNDTIKSIVKICRNTFDKSIDIVTGYYEEKAITYADPTQVEQSLLNLCINASHAMTIMREDAGKYGGTLNISLRRIQADRHFRQLHPEASEAEYWDICVGDTGVGMDTKILARIFDPFFTTKREGTGTGLGLAMVYNIIKRHKGVIDVYSQVGFGTTFHIYMPVYRGEIVPSESTDDEAVMRGEGVILVVDDEEVMRQTAKSILMECGYTVLSAENGMQAVEIFRDHKDEIRAVLLDMVMPKMSGRQTYIEMARIDENVQVLLVSGFKQDHRVESILRLGVKGFIQKPYTLKILANRLYQLLQKDEHF